MIIDANRKSKKFISFSFRVLGDFFEAAFIRLVSPLVSVFVTIEVFIASYDFNQLKPTYPGWHGLIDFLEHPIQLIILIAGAIALMVSNVFIGFRTSTRRTLSVELERERSKSNAIAENIFFCLEGFVWGLVKKLKFSEEGKSRISLYTHEAEKNRFIFCVRRSYNPIYEKKAGRSSRQERAV